MGDGRHRVARRLRALFHGDALDRELDEEIRLHIELETEELMRTEGLPRQEARRRALVAFGGVERYRGAHRDVRGVGWIERPLLDVRYALRGLRRSPGFAIAVVVTLALGIGANTAMFSVVDRLLFRAPPLLQDAARSHRVYLVEDDRGEAHTSGWMQYARYADLAGHATTVARAAAFTSQELAVGTGAAGREMNVGIVSASLFGFFDGSPALGRYFTTAEDAPPSGTPVAVLGYGYWRTSYGGRRDVLGRTLQVGATRYTIVGVAPRGFAGFWPEAPPAVYIPVTTYGAEIGRRLGIHDEQWWRTYHWSWLNVAVQRRAGVSMAAVTADLSRAYVQSYTAQAETETGRSSIAEAKPRALVASILSDRGPQASSTSKVATWIGGVALIVWLIACANVANLMLARSLRRRREIAVRLAMGVSRGRLAMQLLTESLLLALLGGAAGVVLAQWGGALLRTRLLSATSTASVIGDARTLVFAGAAALVAGLLMGLAPLLQAGGADLVHDLRGGAREGGYQRSRARVALLVLQATFSALLLVGAGLFVRSLTRVQAVPLGWDASRVALVQLNMRGVELDSARAVVLRRRLLDAARALPDVENAALQVTVPFWSTWQGELHVAGIDSVSRLGEFDLNAVSSGYFSTMGTRILRGRGIAETDVAGAPGAMVVSEAMARKLWPAADPIGKCVQVGADTVPCTYVVGVAENIKSARLDDDASLFYYVSVAQFAPQRGGLFVRTRGDADRGTEILRRALQPLMPGAAYVTVTPLNQVLGDVTRSWRLGATMFVLFGLLALVLAAVGLYSVMAYNVAQRRQELGVRVALGAQVRDVTGLVLGHGLRIAAVGVALGLALALAASRWLEPLLFEESPHDPVVLGGVAAVLLAVAALACFLPAQRAAHVDPIGALRVE